MFSGSLVAIVTPMCADGTIDYAAWDRLLDLHLAAGTTGVVVGGTTGESVTLSEAELLELLVRARGRIGTRMALIAGVGGSNTAALVERVRGLSAQPVDALLVVTPAYNRPTQEGLYRHFEAVAAAARSPVILYNVPSRTAVDLLPVTIARLAKLPRIVAVKEASGLVGRVGEIRGQTREEFVVLSGDDVTAREAVLAGARGVISVTANVVPAAMAAMIGGALRGERGASEHLDAALMGLHHHLFVEANPIPVKWALAEMGLIGHGIRLPLTWLGESHQSGVRSALRAALSVDSPAQARMG